ncbi:MAG: stage II sporulation protein M [Candidatus Methanoperedens sp.]
MYYSHEYISLLFLFFYCKAIPEYTVYQFRDRVLFLALCSLPEIRQKPVKIRCRNAAIGLRLGYEMYRFLKGERTNLKQEFKQGLWFYLVRILPLLFVAAVIESYVTQVIASLVMT